MKRFKSLVIGGIQNKVFNLILATIILMTAAFSSVAVYRNRMLAKVSADTNQRQQEAIQDVSDTVLTSMLDSSLSQKTQMEATIAEDMFHDLQVRVEMMGEYAEKVFSDPGRVQRIIIDAPDLEKDGEISAQLLMADGVTLDDPVLMDRVGLMGNLMDMMTSLYSVSDDTNSCFIALPEGVILVADDRSSSKFAEDGSVIKFDPRTRPWYRQAVEAGHLIFTDVEVDLFTGEIGIVCAMPVYTEGRLAAVVGADLFLTSMRDRVMNSKINGTGTFTVVINQQGHVVFSPAETGIFQVKDSAEAENLRRSDNTKLAGFLMDARQSQTNVKVINVDGENYYMVGAPMKTVGWVLLSAFSQDAANRPAAMLEEKNAEIQAQAASEYRESSKHSQTTAFVFMLTIAVCMSIVAHASIKRVVEPLNTMTKRIAHLTGKNLEFKMEDTFRTGDEIEELAKSFAEQSHKTIEYVETIKTVTAEKERIGTELALAKDIQESMLPHDFPAFPNRTDFDIYASMDPAKEVGGDFYDYFLIDDDHLCLVIADVSGKGVPAALFMMASKIILQSIAILGNDPGQILARTNENISTRNDAEMFVTVWLGILELSTGRLKAANAGHEYPAFRHPQGNYEFFKDKHGLVIGAMAEAPYTEYEVQLEPGSRIFVYTDGLPEATNKDTEMFGADRILNTLNEVPEEKPEAVLEHMRQAVDAFVQDAEQFDDLTMLCLEYKGPNAAAPLSTETAEKKDTKEADNV